MRYVRYARCRVAGIAISVALVLGACTSAPTVREEAATSTGSDQAFNIGGRLSAKRGTEGATANFAWDHAPPRDRIDLSTPFGQVIARIDGGDDAVTVLRPGGATEIYPSWTVMTIALLGAPVPIADLAYWIRGAQRADAPASVERDAQGRTLVLRQRAWEIVYAYPNDEPSARPFRLALKYPDVEPVEVRVVVDRWTAEQVKP